MKSILLFLLLWIQTGVCYSQVGIGTVRPQGALDVTSENGGVLYPRIRLTKLDTQSPVTNPQGGEVADGTIVWNTNLNKGQNLSPGLYYWANAKWNRLAVERTNFVYDKTSNAIPYIDGNACSALATVVTNTTTYESNDQIIPIDLNVSGLVGVICNMTISVKLNHKIFYQTSMYLMAPNGKTLKLTTGNGHMSGIDGYNRYNYNLTFSDAATNNITTFNERCAGCLTGTYKPEGTLDNYIQGIYDFMPATVSTFSSFHDENPNGTWKLYIKDVHLGDNLILNEIKLNISTYGGQMPNEFVLLSERKINAEDANYIVASSNYNANATSNVIQTVITRTTAPVGVATATTLPGTILSGGTNSTYNSVRWTAVTNNDVNANLTPNTLYYYQLWRRAAVINPPNQNENYSFIVKTEY